MPDDQPLRRIVIVGGGTAGWMTAAPLGQLMGQGEHGARCEIVLIESPEIGTVGVGEATLPTIRFYNRTLELDSAEFIRKTQATFKLGIEFKDWGHLGNRFFHGFGEFGPAIQNRSSVMHWLRLHGLGGMESHEHWSTATVMARHNRFVPPDGDVASAANAYTYAFHFDAGLYAAYLRDYAVARGVQREEGTIVDVSVRPGDGFVTAVTLADGRRIEGDLFIDCSGFRALLIEGVCQAGYDDWTHWLPCDSAQAVPCARVEPLTPYTTSTARSAGWQWRIPLQHRTGNGHVFCSQHISEDEATATLLSHLDGEPLAEPRTLKFVTGMRKQCWNRNVVAIGLASGFMEPLESTSIHLIQTAIARLIDFFPSRGFSPVDIDTYNRLSRFEYESIRDFIILHYHLNQRTDSAFWTACREMAVPPTLQAKLALFGTHGRIVRENNELFAEVAWMQVMLGQGLQPQGYHPLVDSVDDSAIGEYLHSVHQLIQRCAAVMPDHARFIAEHCAAPRN